MILAAPGQATASYPVLLHNSSNVVLSSQKKCHVGNNSPININGSLTAAVSSKKLLNTLNSMPKTLKRSNSHNNNETATSKRKKSSQSLNKELTKLQNDEIRLNNSSAEIITEINSRENTSPNSRSPSNNYLMKNLSVRLNRDPDLDNFIPKVIISSKNSTNCNTNLNNENPSSSHKANCSANKILNANAYINIVRFDDGDNDTINPSPISIASSSTSAPTPSPASPSPSPPIVVQPTVTYIIPPTKYHRSEQYRRDDRSNTNSLSQDMCHFKPIRSVPITPIKYGTKSRGGGNFYSNAYTLKYPMPIKATNIEGILTENCDVKSNENKNATRKTGAGYKIRKSKLVIPSNKHKSAFVSLVSYNKASINLSEIVHPTRKRNAETICNIDLASRKKQKTAKATKNTKRAKPKKTVNKKAKKKILKKPTEITKSNKSLRINSNMTKKSSINRGKSDETSRGSPPITRSRLKQSTEKKLGPALPYYAKGRDF